MDGEKIIIQRYTMPMEQLPATSIINVDLETMSDMETGKLINQNRYLIEDCSKRCSVAYDVEYIMQFISTKEIDNELFTLTKIKHLDGGEKCFSYIRNRFR